MRNIPRVLALFLLILQILVMTELPARASRLFVDIAETVDCTHQPNHPDCSPAEVLFYGAAWEQFANINQKSDIQTTIQGEMTNNAEWETWADNYVMFPDNPDPSHPPQWSNTTYLPKKLELRSTVEKVAVQAQKASSFRNNLPSRGVKEEIRRNQYAFDYIISNNLWYTQGLKAAFDKGIPIKFPSGSIEVKANWMPIPSSQKSNYHWNIDANGNFYGLVSMHIISHKMPNGFWASWEWIDNRGRCDYIGCHDSFGMNPADILPNPIINKVYDSGELTSDLKDLLKQNFCKDNSGESACKESEVQWLKEWENYRLKGTQNSNFVNAMGQPTLLGNSITEAGIIPSSSCITCHARAAINSEGKNAFPINGFKPALPGEPFPNLLSSYNGAPDPNWFYQYISTSNSTALTQILLNLPTDFVWSIPAHAKPCTKVDCTAKLVQSE